MPPPPFFPRGVHVACVPRPTTTIITEPSGGIAPQGYAHLKMLARTSRLPGGRDGTRYGLSRSSPRSYLTHHLQRISAGIVRANARNILTQVVGVKQRAAVSRV